MPTLLGPWNVQYPINFVANGDTVHEGFNKHIQEIARIYGLLNALDAGKADTSDLTALKDSLLAAIGALSGGPVPDIFMSDLINHINSDNPHPNLLLTNTKGKLPVARVDGLIPYLEADAGFANWIKSLIAAEIAGLGGGSGIGISDFNVGSNDGYIEFGNGVLIQFGKAQTSKALGSSATYYSATATFPKAFTKQPFAVFAGNASFGGNMASGPDMAFVSGYSKETITLNSLSILTATWIAIGK